MPEPTSSLLLTDSGLETVLVFHHQIDLPDFASFPLLDDARGRALMADYYRAHLSVAEDLGVGIVLETPTWRASSHWGRRLGYDAEALDRVNTGAVAFLRELAAEFPGVSVTVSGNLGPRGDGYNPVELLTADEAEAYHTPQIRSLGAARADQLAVLTITHAAEAIGMFGLPWPRTCRWSCPSRSRPTGTCRAASRCSKRSARSMQRRTARPCTSASTAPTPITSHPSWTLPRRKSLASVCSERTRRG